MAKGHELQWADGFDHALESVERVADMHLGRPEDKPALEATRFIVRMVREGNNVVPSQYGRPSR